MTATLAHIAAALALLFIRGPRAAWLSYELWELEHWLRDIGRDLAANGIDDTAHLRECRARANEIRVQLALLQPPRRRAATSATPATTSRPR